MERQRRDARRPRAGEGPEARRHPREAAAGAAERARPAPRGAPRRGRAGRRHDGGRPGPRRRGRAGAGGPLRRDRPGGRAPREGRGGGRDAAAAAAGGAARLRLRRPDVHGRGPRDARAQAPGRGRLGRGARRRAHGRPRPVGVRQVDARRHAHPAHGDGRRVGRRAHRRREAHGGAIPAVVFRRRAAGRALALPDVPRVHGLRRGALRRAGAGPGRAPRPPRARVVRGHARGHALPARPERGPEAAPVHRAGPREAREMPAAGRADVGPRRRGGFQGGDVPERARQGRPTLRRVDDPPAERARLRALLVRAAALQGPHGLLRPGGRLPRPLRGPGPRRAAAHVRRGVLIGRRERGLYGRRQGRRDFGRVGARRGGPGPREGRRRRGAAAAGAARGLPPAPVPPDPPRPHPARGPGRRALRRQPLLLHRLHPGAAAPPGPGAEPHDGGAVAPRVPDGGVGPRGIRRLVPTKLQDSRARSKIDSAHSWTRAFLSSSSPRRARKSLSKRFDAHIEVGWKL